MSTHDPFQHNRRMSRASKGLRGFRLVWREGGRWGRFFLLCPLWWAVYLVILLVASSPQSSDASTRLLAVGFSFLGLLDVWWTPIFSSAVLRASLGTGLNKSDANARLLAEYLESLGHGGTWRFGNMLSLAYLGAMFAFGLFALGFTSIFGAKISWAFYPAYFGMIVFLWSVYQLLLRRLLRKARRAGYPIQMPGRSSS